MRISDWSSDVCSSDLVAGGEEGAADDPRGGERAVDEEIVPFEDGADRGSRDDEADIASARRRFTRRLGHARHACPFPFFHGVARGAGKENRVRRSEERRVGEECVSTCSSGWLPYD